MSILCGNHFFNYGKQRQHQKIQVEQSLFASAERHEVFYPVKRTEKNITFEYRFTTRGELQTLNAFVFVPVGCDYEAAGPIEWEGGEVFLEANRCIERGGKGQRNENDVHEVMIGNKWVKTEDMRDALKAMDEEFLKGIEK